MCGRYAFFAPRALIERVFGVEGAADVEPRYNVAPTQFVPVVRIDRDGRRVLRMQRWGLVPFWARDPSVGARMINARAETLNANAAFREALSQRRCLVPVNGFYEWHGEGAARMPWYIDRVDGEPFALAGLWARWRPRGDQKESEPLDSCTIVTTAPNALIAPLHDRMPAILPARAFDEWLDRGQEDTETISRWLVPADAEGFRACPVSRAVNDARREGEALIRPL